MVLIEALLAGDLPPPITRRKLPGRSGHRAKTKSVSGDVRIGFVDSSGRAELLRGWRTGRARMSISAADFARLNRLFDEALALPEGERRAWFEALPRDELKPRLAQMLARSSGSDMEDFLSGLPAVGDEPADDATVPQTGGLIGPYRLLREIGRGGMGSVWLAERADGNFERQIALKLPRLCWVDGLAARMARERRIGALLEHPNIARMYDAGVDQHGRPFIAMQYIAGSAIDVYCNEQQLNVRARLALFVQVVRAVAYAHGRLVIHRDLKPANVLVGVDGQAQLLDFGIAKLLDEAHQRDNLTEENARAMTPNYASPEQLLGLPIAVTSDVYSLGALLYELLTGALPFSPKRYMLGAMHEAIGDSDAPMASSRPQDRRIARTLRGDVDAILAKALKRESGQRYSSADAMAEDIERHLRGELIQARPDTFLYRLRTVLRRHRVGVVATAAVLTAVIGGVALAMVQAHRASQSAERARVVKEFVVEMFKLNSPERSSRLQLQMLPTEVLLEEGARMIETKFAHQPEMRAELFGVVGRIFVDIGAPQIGAEYASKQVALLTSLQADRQVLAGAIMLEAQAQYDQGEYGEAREKFRRVVGLIEPGSRLHLRARVQLSRTLSKCCEAVAADRELAAVEDALRHEPPLPSSVRAVAMSLRADRLYADNRAREGEEMQKNAISEALAAEGPLSSTAIEVRLALARELVRRHRLQDAEGFRNGALEALRKRGGGSEIRAAFEESKVARDMVESDTIAFTDARTRIERALSLLAERGRLVPSVVRANIELDLGMVYLVNGDILRAEPLISKSIPILSAGAVSSAWQVYLAEAQGKLATYVGKHDQARALLQQALALRASAGEEESSADVEMDRLWLSWNLQMQGQFEEALGMLGPTPNTGPRGSRRASVVEGNQSIYDARADVLLDAGDPRAALELIPPESVVGNQPGRWMDYRRLTRGAALCATKRTHEGLAMLQTAIANDARRSHANSPILARNRAIAGLCALRAGQRTIARELADLAHEAFLVQPGVSSYFKQPSERLDTMLADRFARRAFR
jgi:eukaryotic-like serine/threonine-protein kinase